MIRFGTFRLGVLLALLATLILQASLTASAQESGEWTATDAMVYGPRAHAAALLADGRVLVAGGYTVRDGVVTCSLTDAQIFDSATGAWAATGSSLLSSAEIFDPATGAWA